MNDERIMDIIVDIYNQMDEDDKASFSLEEAQYMVEDQIQIDRDHGRKPMEYDPELFYDTICQLIRQDAED